jgi:site-specific DNA recombinase
VPEAGDGHLWGVYARISQDRTGAGIGVERQVKEVRALIGRVDPAGTIVDLYSDNDVSATDRRRKREQYERLKRDIGLRRITAVGIWHLDRITRHPSQLEELVEYAEELGTWFLAVHGDIDLRTHTGRLTARVIGAAARNEIEQKSARQKAAWRHRAEKGEAWDCGVRCFGFDHDGKTLIEDEAEVLRDAASRLLPPRSESLRSVVASINAKGVKTTRGGPFRPVTLRRLLVNPRMAGKAVHKGEVVAEGKWERILTPETQERLVALFKNSAQKARNYGSRRYLLSGGLLRCGLCGNALQSQSTSRGTPGYVCRKVPEVAGCGRIRIAAAFVEQEVAARVLARFGSPAVQRRLAAATETNDEGLLVDQIRELEERLAALGEDYAEDRIPRVAFQAAANRLQGYINDLRGQIVEAGRMASLPEGLGPLDLAQWWADATLEQRRDLIMSVLDHVSVGPVTRRGYTGPDLERLNWVWK